MIQNIQDTDEPSFLRHWSARAWDEIQLAHIAAVEERTDKLPPAQLSW